MVKKKRGRKKRRKRKAGDDDTVCPAPGAPSQVDLQVQLVLFFLGVVTYE